MLKPLTFFMLINVYMISTTFAQKLQCLEDYPNIIAPELKEMMLQLSKGDYTILETKTHPSLIEYSGGKEAYLSVLKLAQSFLANQNIEITDIKTEAPTYTYFAGDEEVCFIPKMISMKISGKAISVPPSYMVAVRTLNTQEWRYIEGANLQKKPHLLYVLFPKFPKDAKLPYDTNEAIQE
ncbi:hypothetical protein [Acinetobacter shaoyimingii]|uniref:Nuclear transport factor 2 family protein n=1 Tax=Acinetobacter shaoyimingii TaxID=2715164 RepID=A0A6G8RZC9_9GAMM|nr:hypothetical protein [Acinetobacter shaoyimingii]QIO07306.1 hypothetical protein G8E00_15850 [Acinetobacter shaoyimingii]